MLVMLVCLLAVAGLCWFVAGGLLVPSGKKLTALAPTRASGSGPPSCRPSGGVFLPLLSKPS